MASINSILDHHSPTTDQIFKTGVALSTHPSNLTIEPLPQLNYFLTYQLITLARPHLSKRELKRMDYMVDARRSFYQSHHKFQAAYRDLLDVYACAEILDKRSSELKRQLADALADRGSGPASSTRQQLRAIELQRRSNNEDMRLCLHHLRAKAKTRQDVAAWYSHLKMVFLTDEMPWLTALGKQSYDRAQRHRATRPVVGSLAAPGPHVVRRRAVVPVDRVDSDHCSDSGGTSAPDVEMQDCGLGSGGELRGRGEGERVL